MTEAERADLRHKIDLGIKTAIAEALEDHRRHGRTIVVWQDGGIKYLTGDEIKPQMPNMRGEIDDARCDKS